MKKMVFFVLLLAFSRVGVALGMGTTPVGIGNFFLGSPSITESNLNQVLGLLVGPAGSPGVAGVSGSNGKDGLNGLAPRGCLRKTLQMGSGAFNSKFIFIFYFIYFKIETYERIERIEG